MLGQPPRLVHVVVRSTVWVEFAGAGMDCVAIRVSLEIADLSGKLVGCPQVIAVQEGDIVAFCRPGPDISGCGDANIFLQRDKPDGRLIFREYPGGVVPGSVVNHDNFFGLQGLFQNTLQGFGEQILPAVEGDYH